MTGDHGLKRRKSGFSYVETTMALFMLIVGFLGLYASFEVSGQVRETANETNVAMFKLQTALDTLFAMPFDDVTTRLPQDTPVRLETITDSLPDNDFQLRDEVMTIHYSNPASDPLFFTVTINWTSRSNVPRTEEIQCARAR